MEIIEIVTKIEKLSKKHLSEQDKPIFQCIMNDKNEMISIISLMKKYLLKIECLTENMKMFHMLGLIPRFGKNMYICSCFVYWFIKLINPSIEMYVNPDGTIRGFIPAKDTNNREHIILQAHMDVVCLDSDEQAQHFGVYGQKPNVQFYHSDNGNELWINKNNDCSVLGADDGKGVAEILNLLKFINNNAFKSDINWPNISFLLTSIEESPFGQSICEFCKNNKNINKLFPKRLNNILYINLDSYCGTHIDTHSNLSEKAKELEQKIIKQYKNFVENKLLIKSTQEFAWHNPPSEVLFLSRYIQNLKQCENICFVSMNADSINPHSNQENIDLIKFEKFCNWFNNVIVYKNKK